MRNVIRINDGWLFTLDEKTETVNLPHTDIFEQRRHIPKSCRNRTRKRSSNAEESTQRRKSESTTSLSQSTRADIPRSESISPTISDTAAALT